MSIPWAILVGWVATTEEWEAVAEVLVVVVMVVVVVGSW